MYPTAEIRGHKSPKKADTPSVSSPKKADTPSVFNLKKADALSVSRFSRGYLIPIFR